MADELKAGAAVPAGAQNVVITEGSSVNTMVQAPTSTGNIWFAFEIGSGSFTLNVNFNGQNYPNIPPGQYQLYNLSTPLGLTVQGNGSTKLAWVAD
jgi:hypothetical protein